MLRWGIPVVIVLVLSQALMAQTAQSPAAEAPAAPKAIRPLPIGTMSELMIRLMYPTSNAIFYIETRTPTNNEEWETLANSALTLAESANLLMMPGRSRDDGKWMTDSKLLFDVGNAAFKLAKKKDVDGLAALNDQLYASCVTCHEDYRSNYAKGHVEQNIGPVTDAPAPAPAPAAPAGR